MAIRTVKQHVVHLARPTPNAVYFGAWADHLGPRSHALIEVLPRPRNHTLATVEAMKMENILRAEKKAKVSKICAGPGDSLAVDETIMEFE